MHLKDLKKTAPAELVTMAEELGVESASTLRKQDLIRIGLAGTLKDFVFKDYRGNTGTAGGVTWNGQPAGYATDPADIINYVSKHDNEALWDKLQFELDSAVSIENRVRIHNIALAIPLLSQGIPFLQMGDDLLRSKSLDRNSYDSGDWFNRVFFDDSSNNWNIGLPLAQDNPDQARIAALAANTNIAVDSTIIATARDVFAEYLNRRLQQPHFANARSVRNALDRMRLRQASRLFADRDRVLSAEDLTTLLPQDIRASRVFQAAAIDRN